MLLNLDEAALRVGVPRPTLASWAYMGTGPKTAPGRRYHNPMFDDADLDAWLKANISTVGKMVGKPVEPWPEPEAPRQRSPIHVNRRNS